MPFSIDALILTINYKNAAFIMMLGYCKEKKHHLCCYLMFLEMQGHVYMVKFYTLYQILSHILQAAPKTWLFLIHMWGKCIAIFGLRVGEKKPK